MPNFWLIRWNLSAIPAALLFVHWAPGLGLGTMQRVSEYEKNAAACRASAAQIKDPKLKKQMEDMAEVWERLARERQQGIVETDSDKLQPETDK